MASLEVVLKRLLNVSEQRTNEILEATCQTFGARVCAMVRMADVLPIERSGIDADDFSFCLRAHFDFVVLDTDWSPLFVVEFDGPLHRDSAQRSRDQRKNRLCLKFDCPLIRVDDSFIDHEYAGFTLLAYFVHVWFMHSAFLDAQREGIVPLDELFDPCFVMWSAETGKEFPYWLSATAQVDIQRRYVKKECLAPCPSTMLGRDADDDLHCLAWLALSEGRYLAVRKRLRGQQFPIDLCDLATQLTNMVLHRKLLDSYQGSQNSVSESCLIEEAKQFMESYTCSAYSGSGPGPDINLTDWLLGRRLH